MRRLVLQKQRDRHDISQLATHYPFGIYARNAFVYSRALTDEEISTIYTNTNPTA